MMAKANNQVLWLLRRLDSIISQEEIDGVVVGGRRSHDDATAVMMRDAGFSLPLGSNRFSETSTIRNANVLAMRKDTIQLTVFDLQHLAEIYRKSNDHSLSLLLKSLEMDELEFVIVDILCYVVFYHF